jgi:tetratricopeptide (TPR) repeat protein
MSSSYNVFYYTVFTVNPEEPIIHACFNKGLCYNELLDIENALLLFEETVQIRQQLLVGEWVDEWVGIPEFCLSFLYSSIGNRKKAEFFKEKATHIMSNFTEYTTIWSKNYGLLFLGLTDKNLGNIEKSFELYRDAIKFSEITAYPQVKAKALTGLGELYRIQKDYDTALDHHVQSIETLDKIGAKCDLAEAYFQLALTYQAMGDQPNSQTYFDKALDLWGPKQIDAPKQIERVRMAMQTIPE